MKELIILIPEGKSLSTPPNSLILLMDLVLREYVPLHEYVEAHNLSSTSEGDGSNRHLRIFREKE